MAYLQTAGRMEGMVQAQCSMAEDSNGKLYSRGGGNDYYNGGVFMVKVGDRVRNPHLKDEYYVSSVHDIDGVKVVVHRPILTDYQRMIREKMAADTIADVLGKLYEEGKIDLDDYDGESQEVV